MTDAVTYNATTLEEWVELVNRLVNERSLCASLMYRIDSNPPRLRFPLSHPTWIINKQIESGQLAPEDVVARLKQPKPVLVVDFPELHKLAAAVRPRLHDEEYLLLFEIDGEEDSWRIRYGPYQILDRTGTDLRATIDALIQELNAQPEDFTFGSTDEVSRYVEHE